MSNKSFQESYYLHDDGLWRRVWRDIRFIGYICGVIYYWTVPGGRVRRAYEASQRRGETLRIDALDGEEI